MATKQNKQYPCLTLRGAAIHPTANGYSIYETSSRGDSGGSPYSFESLDNALTFIRQHLAKPTQGE